MSDFKVGDRVRAVRDAVPVGLSWAIPAGIRGTVTNATPKNGYYPNVTIEVEFDRSTHMSGTLSDRLLQSWDMDVADLAPADAPVSGADATSLPMDWSERAAEVVGAIAGPLAELLHDRYCDHEKATDCIVADAQRLTAEWLAAHPKEGK